MMLRVTNTTYERQTIENVYITHSSASKATCAKFCQIV